MLNPSQAPALISYFIAWQTYRIVNWTLRTLRFLIQELPLLISVGLNLAIVNLGGVAALTGPAGLSGLAGVAQPVGAPPPRRCPTRGPGRAAGGGRACHRNDFGVPAVPPRRRIDHGNRRPSPAPPAVPPVPPAPVTGTEGFGYMVGSLGLGQESALSSRTRSRRSPVDTAAASVSATAPDQQRPRARRRPGTVIDRGYGYEYLDIDNEPTTGVATPSASTNAAGRWASPGGVQSRNPGGRVGNVAR
ncbi:PPE1 domain protein [Mycobacterium xenopi 4042]|uniref:PPE1 domain protein n=1 Tax=Mycobacterium xenopi 4042 TaxID=1299334 RepID=X7ZWE9_MYCXE|nr:PPE1 domain protein [Mycobacterium xenopi 4042]